MSGLAWAFSGDVTRAAAAYEEAVSLLRKTGVTIWEAMALAELGDTRLMIGDVAAAVPLLDEALALHRRIEYPVGIAVTLGERAHAARMQGDQVLASRLFAESIAVAAEIGSERILLGAVAGLAGVALALGQPERAARVLSAVEAAGRPAASAGSPTRPTPRASSPRRGPASLSRCSSPPGRRVGTSRLPTRLPTPAPSPHPPGSRHQPRARRRRGFGLTAARTRRAAPAGRGTLRSPDRRGALHRHPHRADPRRQPLRQARRQHPRRSGGRRGAPRPRLSPDRLISVVSGDYGGARPHTALDEFRNPSPQSPRCARAPAAHDAVRASG